MFKMKILFFFLTFLPISSWAWNGMCFSPVQYTALHSQPKNPYSTKSLEKDRERVRNSIDELLEEIDDGQSDLAKTLSEQALGDDPKSVAAEVRDYIEGEYDRWPCLCPKKSSFISFLDILMQGIYPVAHARHPDEPGEDSEPTGGVNLNFRNQKAQEERGGSRNTSSNETGDPKCTKEGERPTKEGGPCCDGLEPDGETGNCQKEGTPLKRGTSSTGRQDYPVQNSAPNNQTPDSSATGSDDSACTKKDEKPTEKSPCCDGLERGTNGLCKALTDRKRGQATGTVTACTKKDEKPTEKSPCCDGLERGTNGLCKALTDKKRGQATGTVTACTKEDAKPTEKSPCCDGLERGTNGLCKALTDKKRGQATGTVKVCTQEGQSPQGGSSCCDGLMLGASGLCKVATDRKRGQARGTVQVKKAVCPNGVKVKFDGKDKCCPFDAPDINEKGKCVNKAKIGCEKMGKVWRPGVGCQDPPCKDKCQPWKKTPRIFGRGGQVNSYFCTKFAKSGKADKCKKILAQLKEDIADLKEARAREEEIEADIDHYENMADEVQDHEAKGICIDCVRKIIKHSRPTMTDWFSGLLRAGAGTAIGYAGYRSGMDAQYDANMIRMRQGQAAQTALYAHSGAGLGYPLVQRGIMGMTLNKAPIGGFDCTPTLRAYGLGNHFGQGVMMRYH